MYYADSKCEYTEEFIDGEYWYIFRGPCKITHKIHEVRVPGKELYEYRMGKYIQEAMKSVSAGDREFLMSGYSPEGWKQMFYEDDEEEDHCECCGSDLQDYVCQNPELRNILMLGLYKFYLDCGRNGSLEGVFLATQKDIDFVIGKYANFGEVLGKHSEIGAIMRKENFEFITDDPQVTRIVRDYDLSSGYNPLDYLELND